MLKTLAITVLIIAICIALLSVKVIFKKNGKFSSQHIHDNEALYKRASIACSIRTVRQGKQTKPIKNQNIIRK